MTRSVDHLVQLLRKKDQLRPKLTTPACEEKKIHIITIRNMKKTFKPDHL